MRGFLSVPHTNVSGTFFSLSSVFNIFLAKCGQLEHLFGFPKLNGPLRDETARLSDRIPPYGKILLAKVASICDLILPKTHMCPDRFENMKSLRFVPAGTRSVSPYAIQT